jgi:hypothetical protein
MTDKLYCFDFSAATGPLSGLKVVELGQLIAGPFAAKTLGDFGADIIKIEPPRTGDPLRQWRLLKDGTSVWWQVQSRNKRSLVLDLKEPQAQDIVRQLVMQADVLIENFRPGAMEGWGLGPEALLAFARATGAGIIEHGKRNFFNAPTEEPHHLGFEPLPALGEADLVIAPPPLPDFLAALQAAGIGPGTIRLSIGLEDPDDLLDDLKKALKAAEKAA